MLTLQKSIFYLFTPQRGEKESVVDIVQALPVQNDVFFAQAIKYRCLNTISPNCSIKGKRPTAGAGATVAAAVMMKKAAAVGVGTSSATVGPGTPPAQGSAGSSTASSSGGGGGGSGGGGASSGVGVAAAGVGAQSAALTAVPSSASSYSAAAPAPAAAPTATPAAVEPSVQAVPQHHAKQQSRANTHHPCYQCCSLNENSTKKLCRKQPLALLAHTETQLMRTYPAGMRIDSSNFNPVMFWSFGIQMVALNYQTEDAALHLNSAMFEQNGRCGYVCKPAVMWERSHMMYRRFNPWDKQFDGLHSSHFILTIMSGQYVCTPLNTSTFVEVEVVGIPVDCNKQKTKVVQRNALNPIWNDTFFFQIMFRDLAFLRLSVLDAGTNHLLAQRVLPLKCLRPGYRHVRLRNPQNQPLSLSTLFVYSRLEEESLDYNGSSLENGDIGSAGAAATSRVGVGGGSSGAAAAGALAVLPRNSRDAALPEAAAVTKKEHQSSGVAVPLKRRMFFLMVYGVLPEEPYTILKITQESSTQEVVLQALQRAGLGAHCVRDYILVEEVARSWEKKDRDMPATQRVLDLQERPLQAQGQWQGEGRFLLKRMGDDPSSRAWLSSIRSTTQNRRQQAAAAGDAQQLKSWEETDTFLVCVHNVSPEIPYAILKVPVSACAQDVLAQALVKARRMEDPTRFVLMEELEWGGGGSGASSGSRQQRVLDDEENVYRTQAQWQTIGRFILRERDQVTPHASRRHRVNLRTATLEKLSKGLSVARSGNKEKVPVQEALSDPTTSRAGAKHSKPVTSSSLSHGYGRGSGRSSGRTLVERGMGLMQQRHREVHSEGETLSDDDASDFRTAVSHLKRVSLRKLRVWKS